MGRVCRGTGAYTRSSARPLSRSPLKLALAMLLLGSTYMRCIWCEDVDVDAGDDGDDDDFESINERHDEEGAVVHDALRWWWW